MMSLLLITAFVAGAAAQLTINTPPGSSLTQCEPFLIQWSGGTAPYFVSVQNSPQTGSSFLDFGQQSGTSLTWPAVNATVGTQLIFLVKDSTGASQTSAPFSIVAGTSDSCVTGGSTSGSAPAGGSSSSSPAATGGSSTPATGGTSAPPPTSGSSTASSPNRSSTSPASSGSSASGSPSSGAALPASIPAGVFPACMTLLLSVAIALLA